MERGGGRRDWEEWREGNCGQDMYERRIFLKSGGSIFSEFCLPIVKINSSPQHSRVELGLVRSRTGPISRDGGEFSVQS